MFLLPAFGSVCVRVKTPFYWMEYSMLACYAVRRAVMQCKSAAMVILLRYLVRTTHKELLSLIILRLTYVFCFNNDITTTSLRQIYNKKNHEY